MRQKTVEPQRKRAPALKNSKTLLAKRTEASQGAQHRLESEFRSHAGQWRRETMHVSSLTKMITHPSYLRIIGMGSSVLPFLFKELEKRPDHWLVALNAITGRDPAPPNCTFDAAVAAWLDWGRKHGYL